MRMFSGGWVFAAVGLMAAATAQAFELPLSVEEPAGLARTMEPVSGGIPLPAGAFKADQAFALFDANGQEVPLQALPLVVDEKGFLRWVLLDFQTDLGAKEQKTFTLKAVKGTAVPAKPVKVTQTAGGVTVDTGKAAFTIAADKPFTLFTTATAGGVPVVAGGEVSYVDGLEGKMLLADVPDTAATVDGFAGKKYVADKPASIEVEYAGPLRATVCVKGGFVGDEKNKFQYIARITAWAGKSAVHVKYSLANSNEAHYAYRLVRDSTLRLNLAGKAGKTVLGASKPLEAAGDAWMHQSMRVVSAVIHTNDVLGNNPWLNRTPGATGPGGCKAVAGSADLWTSQGKGDVAEGWLAAQAGEARLWVTDLYFVEDPPRRMAVKDNAVELTGVTEALAGTTPPFGEPVRWLFDCSHLSSQYLIDFAAPADNAALSEAARRGRSAPRALAPPAWYFETEGLPVGKFGTRADELTCYDTWGWKYDPDKVPQGLAGEFTRINRYVAADDNHFTSEQDTLDGLLLMYLRTGHRAFYDAAQAWANYFMDLEVWRTDGWRWKDGGVWWHGGPAGNRPQRPADPVTGVRNSLPAEWTQSFKTSLGTFGPRTAKDINLLFLAKQCHCHNWGEGLAEWFLITGDRDAYEAAIDCVEQNYDTQRRAFRKTPGQPAGFSRDFTRSCYLTNAARLMAPTDPFVVEASDYLAAVYLQRPNKEPRGLVNAGGPLRVPLRGKNSVESYVGQEGLAEMERLGVTFDEKAGLFTDPRTGAKWHPITGLNTWMYPPLSRAMEVYYRITGNEDALDWLIAYGQAVGRVMYQRHGNQHPSIMADFPVKGVVKDLASWTTAEDNQYADGVRLSGYLAQFYPDVPARAYELSGEPVLKQRAYDYWFAGSHRGYQATKMHNLGGVGQWVNVYTTHGESVSFTGKTFYIWAHPRQDAEPPAAVADLAVSVRGDRATVTFTAPADQGGGKVARYQVKCADKPIVDYETFLRKWAANEDAGVINWWMAANLGGEPAPQAAGGRESFTVTGVPAGAKYFAVRSFDDSSNRSALSNVAEAK